MPRKDCDTDDSWYPGATKIVYDDRFHQLDEATVRAWLEGLDVAFTVETPNDWRIPTWCREMGVKLIVQGNPEFVRHGQPDWRHESPDEWWWPTSWRLNHLPAGPVMPVPMPDDIRYVAAPIDETLKIVHVIGKRAHADRNGTAVFMDSLRATRLPIHITMYSIDGVIDGEIRRQRNISTDVYPWGVTDRWEMYQGHHLLVLPRRYGGLCLPALEAAASGLGVMMTDCPPNDELASVLVSPRRTRSLAMACGIIEAHDINHLDLGAALDEMARHPDRVEAAMLRSYAMVPRWSVWRQRYLDRMAELVG
jgi:hypothetical protein